MNLENEVLELRDVSCYNNLLVLGVVLYKLQNSLFLHVVVFIRVRSLVNRGYEWL